MGTALIRLIKKAATETGNQRSQEKPVSDSSDTDRKKGDKSIKQGSVLFRLVLKGKIIERSIYHRKDCRDTETIKIARASGIKKNRRPMAEVIDRRRISEGIKRNPGRNRNTDWPSQH